LSVFNNVLLEQSPVTYSGGKLSCRMVCWGRLETVIETELLVVCVCVCGGLVRCVAWKAVSYELLKIITLVYSAAEHV